MKWQEKYQKKIMKIDEAFGFIRSGKRIFIGSACGEPQHLVRRLAEKAHNYTDIEIVRLMSMEATPLSLLATKTEDTSLNIRFFYIGSAASSSLARNKRFMTPINLFSVPMLFKSGKLPIDIALIQVSPPDDDGNVSLGISVDITRSAALSADVIIAQVNPNMPRTSGKTKIHVDRISAFVEYEEPLLTPGIPPKLDSASITAEHITRLIDDGATIQLGLGTIPEAVFLALHDKNDLGIHTHYMTDEIMELMKKGVITNKQKDIYKGKSVVTSAIGTESLYSFLNENQDVLFFPSDYVANPAIIAQNKRMTALNVASGIDLVGQVTADAFPHNNFCGVNSMPDFSRGAAMAKQGKTIIILTSTTQDGKKSRIVPFSEDMIVIPNHDIHYVVTEYGAVNLFGKSLKERAIAMISLAHPNFRDELFYNAKKIGLIGSGYKLSKFTQGVYPLKLEEIVTIGDTEVTIRPSKPVDERRIQEHFYNLDMKDVVARFFHKKNKFISEEIKDISQIDYKNNLTLLAVVGEFGFGRVVGIGEYFLDPNENMAEVAFSISKDFQHMGMGKILMKKLAYAAVKNGIKGFTAYVASDNNAMIQLFSTLDLKVTKYREADTLLLKCKFDENEKT